MENQNRAPSVDDSSISPDQEKDSGMNEIGDDEVILLQMVESNNEPVSPNLKAVLGKSAESTWTTNQSHPAPSLVQHPRISGIDLSAFSFSRPAPHGKAFTLQAPAKQSSAVPAHHNSTTQDGCQGMNRESEHIAQDHRRENITSRPNKIESGGCHQSTAISPSPSQAPTLGSTAANKQTKPYVNIEYITGTDVQTSEQDQDKPATTPRSSPAINSQLLSPENERQATPKKKAGDSYFIHRRRNATQEKTNGRSLESPKQNARQWKDSYVTERPEHEDELEEGNVSLAPINNESRVMKRRRTNGRRVTSRQLASVLADSGSSGLSEEDLFQLLIGKLKAREEGEAVASSLKEQMEASISELTEENNALKARIETFSTEIQRKTSESRAFKSQVEAWKTKLGKFMYLLNELGSSYKILRGEANQLKTTRATLNKDRKEISHNIAETKGKLVQVSTVVGKSHSHLLESQALISSLEQALKNAEEKAAYVQGQLSDEKKRSAGLEMYIQDSSRLQARKIGLIRSDQLGMIQKLDSSFETVGKQVDMSQTTTQSMLREVLGECHTSVQRLSESYAQDKLDLQQCNETVQKLSSQIRGIAEELSMAIQKCSEVDGTRTQLLTEQLQSFGETVESGSVLLQQHSTIEARYISLQERLEAFLPNIDSLSSSLGFIQNKENILAQQMEQLDRRLSEVQALDTGGPTAAEIKEKLELELRIQHQATELALTEENLKGKQIENEEIKHSLLEAVSKTQETEIRANSLLLETIALRDEVKTREISIREELNRASVVARDQNRVKYEQQIHGLIREKVALQKCIGNARDELAVSQKTLTENQATYLRKQKEAECLLLEKEKQIQTLESNQTEQDASLAEKDAEIRRLREMEASIVVQQLSIQRQLEEATEKIGDFQKQLTIAKEENIASAQRSQEKLASVQNDFLKKEEECTSIRKELSAERSTSLNLETGKSKAKSEIHALLRRVQDSEHLLKKIKESVVHMDSVSPKEPFSETWNRLMVLLQSAGLKNVSESTNMTEPTDGDLVASGNASATKSVSIPSTPQGSCGTSGNDVVQTTELIYRTQSFQRSLVSSPVMKAGGHEVVTGRSPCIPDSRLSSSIVPFSNLRQQLSPAPCLISEQDTNDIAAMFIPTPEKEVIAERSTISTEHSGSCEMPTVPSGGSTPARTKGTKTESRECNPSEARIQHPQADQPTSHLPHCLEEKKSLAEMPKAVTFAAHNSSTSGEKRKASDFEDGQNQGSTSRTPLTERPVRTSRRTYSRNRQSSQKRTQEHFANQNAPQTSSNTLSCVNTEGLASVENKIAKVATSSQVGTQTRTASGYSERKTSPTSLASGSSRHSSTNGNRAIQQRWPTRGSRGGGRRTRGDRYNARFNRHA